MDLQRMASSNQPVLILGETGTGKSFLAREIHKKSKQNQNKYIHLNIASLNKNLFESELFGHIKGAFTGALTSKKGFCEDVGFGSLFIDEIGELSLEQQSKLLTLIDEKKYFQVGSCIERKFNGRLIFATNRDLKKMVSDGSFREDLYFRLRFFEVELDSLRDKHNLFQIIIDEINTTKIRYNNMRVLFPVTVLNKLFEYSWPGNRRELKNTVEYLFMLDKPRLDVDDVPSWIRSENRNMINKSESSYHLALESFEKAFFKRILAKHEGKINVTAQVAGISKVTLISKLKKYGINRRLYKNLNKVELANGF